MNRHSLKWDTRAGEIARKAADSVGLALLSLARRLFKWSLGRCSWCGKDPGFSSSISRKGLRCMSLKRDCTKF